MRRVLTLTLLCCLLSPTLTYAQNSVRAGASVPPTKNQVIVSLLTENDAARTRIAALEESERALSEEVQRADDATKQWREAHDKALIELGETRATIKSLQAEVTVREQQVVELRSQRDEARGERDGAKAEAKSLRSENRFLKVVLIVREAATFIRLIY